MSYWMKFFTDGTKEKGTDADVATRRASWSRGRLDGITYAILSFAGVVIRVDGTDIWQKDQYVASSTLPSRRVARSLGVRIMPEDVGKKAYAKHEGNRVYKLELADKVDGNSLLITPEMEGHWLVLKMSRVGTLALVAEEKYRV